MTGQGTSDQFEGDYENDYVYYDYEDPPVRIRKSHKREILPYNTERVIHGVKYHVNTDNVTIATIGDTGISTDDNNERILPLEDAEIQGNNSSLFVKGSNPRRRGGGKAKCKERSLELRQGRKMKYCLHDMGEDLACLSDCPVVSSGPHLSSRQRIKASAVTESQPFLHTGIGSLSLSLSTSPLSTASPISKRTKHITQGRSLPPLQRQASTRHIFLDEVGECPTYRRQFISRFLPLLHSNLIATRDRINTGSMTRPGNWGSVDLNKLTTTTANSSNFVEIRELWREILLWLQNYNASIVELHFQLRDELAEQLVHDISTFIFQSALPEDDFNLDLSTNYLCRLHECMLQVEPLLQQVDRLAYLCLSQRHLHSLYPALASPKVRQRLASMYMWRRMVHHLNTSIYTLFDHLGAHRQSFALLLIDFQVPLLNEEDTLDLCVNDVAQFEDDILIKRWPNYLRGLCVGSYPPLRPSLEITEEDIQMEGCLNTISARNSLYRKYVNKNIHRDGLAQLRQDLKRVLNSVVPFAVHSLKLESFTIGSTALMDIEEQIHRINSAELQLGTEGFGELKHVQPIHLSERVSSSDGEVDQESASIWCDAFEEMNLPSFLPHFLFLVRCPVDILYQCMLARGDSDSVCNTGVQNDNNTNEHPSPLGSFSHDIDVTEDVIDYATVVQLFRECKETLLGAIQAKLYFQQMTMQVLSPSMYVKTDLCASGASSHGSNSFESKDCWRYLPEEYDNKLRALMQDYFRYLWHILTRLQDCQESLLESSGFDTILENEWKFMKIVSPHIPDGEVEASRLFCRLVAFFVKSIEQFISNAWNELVRTIDKERSDIELADVMATFNDTEETLQGMNGEDELSNSEDENSDFLLTDSRKESGGSSYADVHSQSIVPQFSLEDGTPLSSSPSDYRWHHSSGNAAVPSHSLGDNSSSKMRRLMMKSFRDIEDIFDDAKKRLQKAADNIKFLCRDLQLAASMSFTQSADSQEDSKYSIRRSQECQFINILLESGHVLVNCDRHARPDHLLDEEHHDPCSHFDSGKISLFVPQGLATNGKRILQLLGMTFGDCSSDPQNKDDNFEYLLFVECGLDDCSLENEPLLWKGKRLRLHSNVDHTVKLSHAEVSGILMMTADGCQLERLLRHLLAMCPPGLIEVRDPHRACNQSIALALDQLKDAALNLGDAIPDTIARMQEHLLMIHSTMDTIRLNDSLDTRTTPSASDLSANVSTSVPGFFDTPSSCNVNSSPLSTNNPLQCEFKSTPSFVPPSSHSHANKVREKFRDCMQRCYRTAFFYHRELLRMTTKLKVRRSHLAPSIVRLLDNWMTFLRNYYEKSPVLPGGGLPSWAHDGCAFLQTVLQSNLVTLMSKKEWNILQNGIVAITPHLMGVTLEGRVDGQVLSKLQQPTYASQLIGAVGSFQGDASCPPMMLNNQFSHPAIGNSEGKEMAQDGDYRRAFSLAGFKPSSVSEMVAEDSPLAIKEPLSKQSSTNEKAIAKIPLLSPVEELNRDFVDDSHMNSPSLKRVSSLPGQSASSNFLDNSFANQSEEKSSIMEVRKVMLQQLDNLDDSRTERLQKTKIIGQVRDNDKDTPCLQSGTKESDQYKDKEKKRAPEPMTPIPQPFVRQVNFKFKIGRKLGKGTFGEVYEAIRLDTNESIVVKRIKRPNTTNIGPYYVNNVNNLVMNHPDMTSPSVVDGLVKKDEQMVADVLREFDMCVTLCHPNLVRYYGIEINGQESLIFMERCPGRTLSSMVDQNLEELVIRKYANKLLHGIAYLHDKNIVHRDIKPENIMLCEPADPNLLKLTDFGSAARTPHNFSSLCIRGSINQSALLIPEMHGTPNYMAPEVCRVGAHGVKCDIWSFACVIWELFEGKRPHHDCIPAHIVYKMAMWKEDSDTLPLYRPKGATDDSWAFISSCLRLNPDERPSSVELLSFDFVKVVVSSLNNQLQHKTHESHHQS